jgi:hypothetical protein
MHRNDVELPPRWWSGFQRSPEHRHRWDHGDCCGEDGLVVQLCFEGMPSGVRFRGGWINHHHTSVTVGTEVERKYTWRR